MRQPRRGDAGASRRLGQARHPSIVSSTYAIARRDVTDRVKATVGAERRQGLVAPPRRVGRREIARRERHRELVGDLRARFDASSPIQGSAPKALRLDEQQRDAPSGRVERVRCIRGISTARRHSGLSTSTIRPPSTAATSWTAWCAWRSAVPPGPTNGIVPRRGTGGRATTSGEPTGAAGTFKARAPRLVGCDACSSSGSRRR